MTASKLGVTLLILFFATVVQKVNAQNLSLKCTVVDSVTKEPLPYTSYSLKRQKGILVTDAKGRFKLMLSRTIQHDTLIFTYSAYKEVQIPVLKLKANDVILLPPKGRLLKTVIVKNRTAKEDSLAMRKEFAKDFVFTKPKVIDAFSLTSINFDILYASLSKKNKQRKKLRAILERDELDNYVDSRFNRRNILRLVKLDSIQLRTFMTRHRPSYTNLKKLTDYELFEYIKRAAATDSLPLKHN
ncbi:hypothetical protein [uncultured Mucilaginibacter sp.]|uniref:hypothetical protein n=1 Tax=uncultured Mucilaginibacter sp. TaxID=797541 RepID=UPI0025E64D40|nr:hypothetical protein [uncultured Mucilaginibacter sp.]